MSKPESLSANLDPWAASSLLQKAIRRGEENDALLGLNAFIQFRGKAVWKRLLGIGFEDIGQANPVLLSELAFLATHPDARDALGGDLSVAQLLVSRMVASAKDRSADHLACSVNRGPKLRQSLARFEDFSIDRMAAVILDRDQPINDRAFCIVRLCEKLGANRGRRSHREFKLIISGLERGLNATWQDIDFSRLADAWTNVLVPLAQLIAQTFDGRGQVINQSLPVTAFCKGIPLYTYDKHTRVGLRAIDALVNQHGVLCPSLGKIELGNRFRVAGMAAFYADAAPVHRRYVFAGSDGLMRDGIRADMIWAGAHEENYRAIMLEVEDLLPELNALRQRYLQSGSH